MQEAYTSQIGCVSPTKSERVVALTVHGWGREESVNFRCAHCQFHHRGQQSSILVNPENGTLLATAWFRDERGVNHQAVACLQCGTVHATFGAPLKALFSFGAQMLSVAFYLPAAKLQQIADGSAPGPLGYGIESLSLKPLMLEALAQRGFLTLTNAHRP